MTGLYLDGGTYIKSFYSVMMAPSCVKIRWIPGVRRLHHRINWDAAVPKIVPEKYRKDRGTWTDPETRIVALGGIVG